MSQTDEPTGPRWERAIVGMFRGMWEWGVLYCLIAVSLGLALFPLRGFEAMRFIVKNDLSMPGRSQALLAVAVSAVVTTAGYVWLWLRGRRSEPGLGLAESFKRTNHFGFVLLALPMLTALLVPKIESKQPVFTSFLSAMITGLVMVFLYRVFKRKLSPGHEPFQPGRYPRLALATFVAAMIGYCVVISAYAVIDHHNFGTAVYDLGIYDNLMWQTAHGYFLDCSLIKGGNHVSAHFDPIIALISVFYRLYMHAETLLVLQTLWLASGAIPLYLLAKRRLGNEWFAAVLGLIYLVYPALHGVNMFDFHSLAFVIPSGMWAVYLLDIGAFKRYWLILGLLLITREDISLLNCFIGAYAILIGRTRTGLVTIVVSLVYLVLVKMFAMPDSSLLMSADKAYSYVYYYDEMIPHKNEGSRGLAISALTNPLFALQVAFKEEKLLFFFHLLAPLLALPFAAGRKLILSVYGLLFIGLASRNHVFSLYFQYSSLLFPMLFVAVPDGLRRVTDGPRVKALGIERAPLAWTLLFGMLTSSLILSAKFGALVPNHAFMAGWNRLVRVPTAQMREKYEWMKEIAAGIPPDASVSMSHWVGPHLSNRRKAYHWPAVNGAEFLVIDEASVKKDDERRLRRLVEKNEYRLVEKRNDISLYVRVGEGEAGEGSTVEGAGKGAQPSQRKTGAAKAGRAGPDPTDDATTGTPEPPFGMPMGAPDSTSSAD